jgi:sensor histidine kinase YesM
MKRWMLHVGFWLSYLALCILIEYMWVRVALPNEPVGELLPHIFMAPVFTSTPEILFAYYMLYRGSERFMNPAVPHWKSITEILVMFALGVMAVRLTTHYVLGHVAYGGRFAETRIWDPNVILRVVLFLGFSSGIALSIKSFRRQVASRDRENALMREKLSTELKMLRNQLHPHFLFNTLNNIYALARKKSDEAPEAVMKLSELLSFILYEAGRDSIPIAREVNFLDDYIALERIRYTGRLSIEFTRQIDNPDQLIAPLLLLPLVENAFKHGISETRFDSFIRMHLEQKQQHFNFMIENSMERDKPAATTGNIGLVNIQRQLQLTYKTHYIEISETEKTYKVSLYINLDSYGKA